MGFAVDCVGGEDGDDMMSRWCEGQRVRVVGRLLNRYGVNEEDQV